MLSKKERRSIKYYLILIPITIARFIGRHEISVGDFVTENLRIELKKRGYIVQVNNRYKYYKYNIIRW